MAGKGSRPGERRGGRKKGTRNKATVIREQGIAASGELPLAYMLRIMRDPNEDDRRRDEMAWRAAPYVHPRPQAQDASVKADFSIGERLERALARAAAEERERPQIRVAPEDGDWLKGEAERTQVPVADVVRKLIRRAGERAVQSAVQTPVQAPYAPPTMSGNELFYGGRPRARMTRAICEDVIGR